MSKNNGIDAMYLIAKRAFETVKININAEINNVGYINCESYKNDL